MQITKMSSLGNEILILNLLTEEGSISSEEVQQFYLKNITTFDQLITIEPPQNANNHLKSTIFNKDGSIADNCINGSRCVAKYVSEKSLIIDNTFIVETDGGNWELSVLSGELFSTKMPSPKFDPKDLPFLAERSDKYFLDFKNQSLQIGITSIGNPHVISFMSDIKSFPLVKWGENLIKNKKFPKGVNLGIAAILSQQEIDLRVYERGAGETLACGSGACAAVVIGNNLGLLDQKVKVNFKIGCLQIEYGELTGLTATGDANFHKNYDF